MHNVEVHGISIVLFDPKNLGVDFVWYAGGDLRRDRWPGPSQVSVISPLSAPAMGKPSQRYR